MTTTNRPDHTVYLHRPSFLGTVTHLADATVGAETLCGSAIEPDDEIGVETTVGLGAGCDPCRKAYGLAPWSPYR